MSSRLRGDRLSRPRGIAPASVRRLTAGQILLVALMSIVCGGAAIGGALGRALSCLLFGIGPLDPSVLASVAALIVGVTVEASAVPL